MTVKVKRAALYLLATFQYHLDSIELRDRAALAPFR